MAHSDHLTKMKVGMSYENRTFNAVKVKVDCKVKIVVRAGARAADLGGQNLKLSAKAAVFKRESSLIGGAGPLGLPQRRP